MTVQAQVDLIKEGFVREAKQESVIFVKKFNVGKISVTAKVYTKWSSVSGSNVVKTIVETSNGIAYNGSYSSDWRKAADSIIASLNYIEKNFGDE